MFMLDQLMIVSFVVASVLGASFVFAFWTDQSIAIGATRSVLFVVILALRSPRWISALRSAIRRRVASTPELAPSTSSGVSLRPFLKLVLIQQLPVLLLTSP